MNAYRIATKRYVRDLLGEGARIYGGRWNRKGTSILYTSESRSLATVEYLVHLPIAILPMDTYIVEISIPNGIEYEQLKIKDLPRHRPKFPAPLVLAKKGEEWIKRNKALFLKVPSAVVKREWNILINPRHELWSDIKITMVEKYDLDERLLRKSKITI